MTVHVAIAEDKPRLAQSLAADLALFQDLRLTGSFRDGRALVDGIAALPHLPDLILMDIEMPRLDGVAATSELKQRYPQIRVLMLTVFEDQQTLFDAVQAGADGYLLKGTPAEDLHRAIREAMSGGAPMTPLMAQKALRLIRTVPPLPRVQQGVPALSTRETEVLEQLAAGLAYKEAAANLHLSVGTIRKHVENIYRKLRVNNKVSAVAKGRGLGLVD